MVENTSDVKPISESFDFSGSELELVKFSAALKSTEQRSGQIDLKTIKYSIIFQPFLKPPTEMNGGDFGASLKRPFIRCSQHGLVAHQYQQPFPHAEDLHAVGSAWLRYQGPAWPTSGLSVMG